LEDWLSARPPKVRGIVEVVRSHVEGLGEDVVLEPTRDALMVKKVRTFAKVKPRQLDHNRFLSASRGYDHGLDVRVLASR